MSQQRTTPRVGVWCGSFISSRIRCELKGIGLRPIERILAAFEGKRSDKIVWQPRIDHWYEVNRKLGTLPAEYRGKELLEIYDDLRPSPRTYRFFDPTIKVTQGDSVDVEVVEDETKNVTTYLKPLGKLREG